MIKNLKTLWFQINNLLNKKLKVFIMFYINQKFLLKVIYLINYFISILNYFLLKKINLLEVINFILKNLEFRLIS